MKALLLKDLYNIGHNARSMLVVLLFLAIAIVPTSGPVAYMVMCGVLCAMMIVTTFTFDEASGWTAYALILPVRRSRLVLAMTAALILFGALFFFVEEYSNPAVFGDMTLLSRIVYGIVGICGLYLLSFFGRVGRHGE